MEVFGAHRCPKDAKMDPKDGPQTSKMKSKIDEHLAWGPYSGQEGSLGSNLKSQGAPDRGVGPTLDEKTSRKHIFLRVVSRATRTVALENFLLFAFLFSKDLPCRGGLGEANWISDISCPPGPRPQTQGHRSQI